MAVVVLPGLLLCMYRHTPLAADLRLAVALQAVLQGQMLRSALSPAFTFSEFAAARCRLVCLFLAAPPPRAAPPPEGRGCPCALPVPPAAWKRHRVRSALLVRGSGPPHRRGLCPVPGALPRLPLGPRGGASPRRRRPALRAVTWPRQPRSLRAPPWLRRPPPAPCSCACSAWRCPAAARCTPRAPCPSTPSPSTRYGPPGGRYRVWQSAGDGGGRWRGGGGEAGSRPSRSAAAMCTAANATAVGGQPRRAGKAVWEAGGAQRAANAGRPSPSRPPHTPPPARGSARGSRNGRGGGPAAPQPIGERQPRRPANRCGPSGAVPPGAPRAALRPGARGARLGSARPAEPAGRSPPAAAAPRPSAGPAPRAPGGQGAEEPLSAGSYSARAGDRGQDRAGERVGAVGALLGMVSHLFGS